MMFGLFIKDILPALHDSTNPYNMQHKYVLVSLTDVKSMLLVYDINDADKLVLQLFNSTFDGISSAHNTKSGEQVAKDIELTLTTMLTLLIDESPGSVSAGVIDAIISQFLRAAPPGGSRGSQRNGNQATLLHKIEPPAYVMASKICNDCADKMTRYVSQYFGDVILDASGFANRANGHRPGDDSDEEDPAGPSDSDLKNLRQAHLLIRELWRAAPTILQNVVPQIEAELSADNIHLRRIATETFGDMISGIGAAGPPPPPVLDPTVYPPLRLVEESVTPIESGNVLTKPSSPQSFAQTHAGAYRSFVGRRMDKTSTIRAAWATAVGYILSTSAGGIGLSRVEENELVKGLAEKLSDGEEKVRVAAVKAIELFDFRDIILKLGTAGGIDKEGSIFTNLGDRARDKKQTVRLEAMVLLGNLWAVGAGEIAEGNEAVISCLGGVPSRIINAFYANDKDLNVLLDRVMFENLIPLKYPNIKGKDSKLTPAEQDTLRAERILLMLKSLDAPAKKAFFAMQARQPQFAKAVELFIQQCEAYNGGTNIGGDHAKVKGSMEKTLTWLGTYFPENLGVRQDLYKFAKLNDRRSYQLIKFATESESDFQKVRRSINELVSKLHEVKHESCLETLLPLLFRSSSLILNRSHLTTIMDYSKSDKDGLASVAHSILNDISQRNPDLFKTHSEELRKSIIDQAPTANKPNEKGVVDILKAYSSYSKKYPHEVKVDRGFNQTLINYALYGTPHKAAKYAVNVLLAKNDDKSKVNATNLLQKAIKDLKYGSPNFLNKMATISQLARLVPMVTADSDDEISELTIKGILREVRTPATEKDPAWVGEAGMNEELQAKALSLKILVNRALACVDDDDAAERVKPLLKLLKTLVVSEGEFCKTKDTPKHHKKHLRQLAGCYILKICSVKKYDDLLDATSFNKLAELVQDSELEVRRRFMEKLLGYITRGRLRPRFYTIMFLVAFEPQAELKNRIETWLRSRARFYQEVQKPVLEAITGRLIPLLAHHPDYSPEAKDLADFARYILFYLNTVSNEKNIALILKYAERVKQTRDALNPDASDNLYILSDLAQVLIRKHLEKKNWSFQAWPTTVGLPNGLYSALPSSAVAQQIAKKMYLPDIYTDKDDREHKFDEILDGLLRAQDSKKVSPFVHSLVEHHANVTQKRKPAHDINEVPSKKAKTKIQAVIREKPKKKAAKKTTRPKKDNASSSPLPPSERRRSGRSLKATAYKERDDEEDDDEMWQGATGWDMVPAPGEEEDGSGDEEDEEDDEEQSDEEEQPRKTKPAIKAKVLREVRRTRNKSESDMEVDDDDYE